jgi:ABC-type Fe3+-hydroxamate transport system substrate-binding protein
VARVPKVGREKDPDVGKILALTPDLVVANVEENRREVVEALRLAGVAVWVVFPRTVAEGIALVRELGALTAAGPAADRLADGLESAYAARRRDPGGRPRRVFCPIWRDPWMTVGRDTYVHDVLAVSGGLNIFADRGDRYPTVTLEETAARAPEVILLPDEPYRFRPAHLPLLAALRDTPAMREGHVHFVDGKLLSWYGRRLGEALRRLPAVIAGSPAPGAGPG